MFKLKREGKDIEESRVDPARLRMLGRAATSACVSNLGGKNYHSSKACSVLRIHAMECLERMNDNRLLFPKCERQPGIFCKLNGKGSFQHDFEVGRCLIHL